MTDEELALIDSADCVLMPVIVQRESDDKKQAFLVQLEPKTLNVTIFSSSAYFEDEASEGSDDGDGDEQPISDVDGTVDNTISGPITPAAGSFALVGSPSGGGSPSIGVSNNSLVDNDAGKPPSDGEEGASDDGDDDGEEEEPLGKTTDHLISDMVREILIETGLSEDEIDSKLQGDMI